MITTTCELQEVPSSLIGAGVVYTMLTMPAISAVKKMDYVYNR